MKIELLSCKCRRGSLVIPLRDSVFLRTLQHPQHHQMGLANPNAASLATTGAQDIYIQGMLHHRRRMANIPRSKLSEPPHAAFCGGTSRTPRPPVKPAHSKGDTWFVTASPFQHHGRTSSREYDAATVL